MISSVFEPKRRFRVNFFLPGPMLSRTPFDEKNFDSRGGRRLPVMRVCRASVAGFFLVGVSFQVPSSIQSDLIRIPSGSAIVVDGKISLNKWRDSKFVRLPVAKNWTIRVRFKHDAENIYFEFEGVKRGAERLFPEILIDPNNRKSEAWEPGEWWLHVSHNLCEGNGEPNVYTKNGVFQCGHTRPGWAGNNPPVAETDIVEVRVSFAKLGLNVKAGTRFGIAFDMTDATGDEKQRWFFWPRGARLESPKSWGIAVLD
jgi:hypothetical protein